MRVTVNLASLALWVLTLVCAPGVYGDRAAAWHDYIAGQAIALPTVDAVAELAPAFADRELVLLGETTHGTHEYYTWRAAISKALIEQADFRFIAVEGDWAALDRLDRYVRHRDDEATSARAVLRTLDRWAEWMWANPVIEELAEWLRAFNADRPPAARIGIHGIDVYGWGDSVALLPDFLSALEPDWGARAAEALTPLRRIGGDSQAFVQAAMRNQPTGADKLERIHTRLRDEADTLRETDPEAWMQARQQTALIRQAKRHLRQSAQRQPRSWNPRAENFMQTVERLRDYYGEGARGVVWAHNTHIGDARYTPMGMSGLITIGQRARERLGEDNVFLLGFASDTGDFRAGRHWGGPGTVIPLPTAIPGTLDAFLRDAIPDAPAYFVPLAGARGREALMEAAGHRAVGIVHPPNARIEHSYVPSVIPRRYDGLLFIRATRALAELE